MIFQVHYLFAIFYKEDYVDRTVFVCKTVQGGFFLALLHSEWPKLYTILVFLSAIGLTLTLLKTKIVEFADCKSK